MACTHLASFVLGTTALLLLAALQPRVDAVASRDGFNLYKDLLRGKGEEVGDQDSDEEAHSPKLIYFYRTPPLNSDVFDQRGLGDLGKRGNVNHYKHYMITRDNLDDLLAMEGLYSNENVNERVLGARVVTKRDIKVKRGPGSILSVALGNRRTPSTSIHADLSYLLSLYTWKNRQSMPGRGFVASMGKRSDS